MSGKNAGVQALLRQQYMPNAIFYSIISKIYTYFHASSVTNETFKVVQQQLNLGKNISSLFIGSER
jgi:hypothetical protein